MLVRCLANTGSALKQKALSLGNTLDTQYNLSIGNEFTVYGQCLWGDALHYFIICETENLPSWIPAELFEVVDHILPMEWYFSNKFFNLIGISAVWGYKELVLNERHFIGLLERESDEIRVFLLKKKEMELYK